MMTWEMDMSPLIDPFAFWLSEQYDLTPSTAQSYVSRVEQLKKDLRSTEPTPVALNRAIIYRQGVTARKPEYRDRLRRAWWKWLQYQNTLDVSARDAEASIIPSGPHIRAGKYELPVDAVDQIITLLDAGVDITKLVAGTWSQTKGYETHVDRIRLWAMPVVDTDPIIPTVPGSGTPMGESDVTALLEARKHSPDRR
jgi:hypothetical protein